MGKRQTQSAAGKEGLAAFSLSIPSMAAAAAGKKEEEEWRLRDWSGEREEEGLLPTFSFLWLCVNAAHDLCSLLLLQRKKINQTFSIQSAILHVLKIHTKRAMTTSSNIR